MGRYKGLMANVALGGVIALAYFGSAEAEPVTDRILSHYELATKDGCQILKINFNIRIRYISHFPVGRGDQLNVIVSPIDAKVAAAENVTPRESLRPPANDAAAIQSIAFEAKALQGATLALQFARPMAFDVVPGQDFQSLLITLTDGKSAKGCPKEDPFRGASWETVVDPRDRETVVSRRQAGPRDGVAGRREAPPAPAPSQGWLTEAEDLPGQGEDGGGGIREARAAMKAGDMARAIQILKRIEGPDALELLGVAYQKSKRTVEAQAAYEEYLRRYGNQSGAECVRQRLAGIETAHGAPGEKLRGSAGEGADRSVQDTSYWTVSGSASEFYIRDDSYQVVRDPTQPLNLNDEAEDHRIHRNVLLSSLDLFAAWGNANYKSKFRFSGSEEHSFSDEDADIVSVASLFYETTIKDWGTTARLGRQTRSSDGVLGRFDGAHLSWQTTPWMRFSVVGGSPVARRKDAPFEDEKLFYGASVNFGPVLGGFDASIFAIEQRDRDIIDRQAVGGELRYADGDKSAFLTLDYDTHFNELNAVIFNGSLTLADKSTVRAAVDYRKAPYLSTSTALQGQPFKTLFDLLLETTLQDAEQMALDRTATYKSASVGYTRQLAEKLQLNLDVTAVEIDGTITSFGVDALPSSGTELYYSAQLIGNDLFTHDDLWTAGARYSDLEDFENYAVDLTTRYLVTKDLRVSPRVLLAYRTGKEIDLEEYSVLPSLLLDYFWTRDLNFELEVGTRLSWRNEGAVETRDTEVFITAGIRYDFYAGSDTLK